MERMLNDPFGAEASAACSLGAYLVQSCAEAQCTPHMVPRAEVAEKHQTPAAEAAFSHVLKHGDEPLC